MKFFHRTRAKNAASILKTGFRDTTGTYTMPITVTGVWVSNKILDESECAFNDVVLQIQVKVSKKDLDFYEIKEEGKPYREWCFPAQLLNKGNILQLPEKLSAVSKFEAQPEQPMKKIPTNQHGVQGNKWATPRLDEACAEFDKIAVEWPSGLPRPNHFPATLKDFLARIVKARTPADSTARFRQFLGASAGRDSFWVAKKPMTTEKRDDWVVSQFQAVKDGDNTGGFFTEGVWLSMGSAYIDWWKDQISIKARESAKKRKKTL